jgi:hypothetical protein
MAVKEKWLNGQALKSTPDGPNSQSRPWPMALL